MKKFLSLLLVPILLFTLYGCQEKKRDTVVASGYFSYDIVRSLAKDTNIKYDILSLPGTKDIHNDNDVTVRSQELLKKANLLVYTSEKHDTKITNNFEGIRDKYKLNLFRSLFPDKNEADFLKHNHGKHGEHHHHEHDKHNGEHHHHDHNNTELNAHDYMHYWASPKNMQKLASIIANRLVEIYPADKNIIYTNLTSYDRGLKDTINDFEVFLKDKDLKGKKIFFFGHDSLGYFFSDFNLKSIYDPFQATVQHIEANPNDINTITSEINEHNPKIIYKAELGEKDDVVKTVKDKLNNKNITVLELTGYHHITQKQFKDNVTYTSLLKQNIKNLKALFE